MQPTGRKDAGFRAGGGHTGIGISAVTRTSIPFGFWLLCGWATVGLGAISYGVAFRLWRPMWLDHVGHIAVLASMPWLLVAAELDMLRGYWHQVTAVWASVSFNLTMCMLAWRWFNRHALMRRAA
jgi:hypothetical protein